MTLRTVCPGRARGRIRAPPSKSYTHRALVAGFLGSRPLQILNALDSDDTQRTLAGIRRLGAQVLCQGHRWMVRPPLTGLRRPGVVRIHCGSSGTTLRFLASAVAVAGIETELDGSEELSRRPIQGLLRALRELGAEIQGPRVGRSVPFRVQGPLYRSEARVSTEESSQFASSLLLALPASAQDTRIHLTGHDIVSEPYLLASQAVLRFFGIDFERDGRTVSIRGGQRYPGGRFRVPGDASSAAYAWVAASITGGEVSVEGISPEWPQADLKILDILRRAGTRVRRNRRSVSVTRKARIPITTDLTDAPDLYPLVGTLAANLEGWSRIHGAPHVTLKESNRKGATIALVRAMGAQARASGNGLEVRGPPGPNSGTIPRSTDHRVVMSAAVGALAGRRPSEVGEVEAVKKSFPGFWKALDRLSRGGPAG